MLGGFRGRIPTLVVFFSNGFGALGGREPSLVSQACTCRVGSMLAVDLLNSTVYVK